MAVMTRKKLSSMPTSDLQWQARKLAVRASKLADRAGPMTTSAARSARRKSGQAATWARPRVGRMRAWTAIRAERGSVRVQDSWAPKMSAALKVTARRLDPPKARTRRFPKLLAGAALLAAGVATAAAVASRNRSRRASTFAPPRPVQQTGTGSSVKVQSQNPQADKKQTEAEVNGLTRTS